MGHGKGDRVSVLVFCETDVTIEVLIKVPIKVTTWGVNYSA